MLILTTFIHQKTAQRSDKTSYKLGENISNTTNRKSVIILHSNCKISLIQIFLVKNTNRLFIEFHKRRNTDSHKHVVKGKKKDVTPN